MNGAIIPLFILLGLVVMFGWLADTSAARCERLEREP